MAQVFFDPNKNKNQDDQPGTQAPVLTTGPADIGPSAQPQQQEKRAGSGRFQNLQKFIGANLQAPKEYEEKISGKIAGEADKVKQQVQSQLGNVQQKAQTEQQRLQQGNQLISQVGQNATQLVQNPSQLQALTQLRQGTYDKGLQLGDMANLQKGISGASELAGMTQSIEGRKGLLRDVYNLQDPRKYGTGASRLDQLLLQADPTSAERLISGGQQQVEQIKGSLSSAEEETQRLQDEIAQQAAQASQQLGQATQQAMGSLRSGLEGRATDYNQRLTEQTNILNNALKQGQISRAELDKLDPDFRSQLEGLSGKYLSGVGADLKANTLDVGNISALGKLATAEEQAQQKALEQIAGTGSAFLSGQVGGLTPGDYGAQDIGGLSRFLSDRESQSARLRDEKAQELSDFEQEQAQRLGDIYYETFGQHTGQGTAAQGRDPRGEFRNLISGGGTFSDDFRSQFIDKYVGPENYGQDGEVIANPRYQQGQEFLRRAQETLGQSQADREQRAADMSRFGRLFNIV